jgi:hypothetical protein
MKEITIQGRTFQYETWWESYGEDVGADPVTIFYDGKQTVNYRKWWIFGPVLQREEPKEVFRIYADSEDAKLSKTWWSDKIRDKIELLNRKEEIEKGELI